MKKLFLLITLLIVMRSHAIGQQTHFTGGILIGLNLSQIDGDDLNGFNKAGPMGGIYINFAPGRRWSFQMEMLYSQKGSSARVDSASLAMNRTGYVTSDSSWKILRLNYFEIPFMAKYKVTDRFSISGGLGLGLLFGAYREDFSTGGNGDVSFLKSTEFTYNFGGTYNLTPRLSAHIRWTESILPISKGVFNINYPGFIVSQYFSQGFYNEVFTFGIYYNFTPNIIPQKPSHQNN